MGSGDHTSYTSLEAEFYVDFENVSLSMCILCNKKIIGERKRGYICNGPPFGLGIYECIDMYICKLLFVAQDTDLET